ncbi:MAG: type II and III secretion system protein family protein [Pseudolabrys sp.]|jgi:pilus assembly protein CpaC
MPTKTLIRKTTLAALIACAALAPTAPVIGADVHVPFIKVAAGDATSRFIPLGVGKSIAIDLPSDVKDVLVGDPKIANAVLRSSRRVYMIGVAVGQTNMFFFDAKGRQIAGFDVAVTRDLNGTRAVLRRMFPDSDIRIDGVGDAVMLTGTAANQDEAQRAFDVASRLVGKADKVVNNITVRGRDQVMLKVEVAEVKREVLKQLGVDISGALGYGSAVVKFNSVNPFVASGANPLSSLSSKFGINPRIDATIRAMERAGVMRTLAEPSLTAISGETANFMAGGEIPIPVGLECGNNGGNCQPKIEFKKFGVSLAFTPVVLSGGRISLKVSTEVSNISYQNSINLAQSISGLSATIPSIDTRSAQTTVEIPSGGSLALAGMIQEQTKQAINGLPGLMQLPILGALFKSRDYINDQSELMVLVTPYLVHDVARKNLSRPDDGFADPSDPSSVLLGRLNRIYGAAGKIKSPSKYHGDYGFILD